MAKELALIGCGNMGSAIVKGIVGSGLIAAGDIVVSDVSEGASARLAGELGCTGTCDNVEAARDAAMVIIAVKPQYLDDVVRGFADAVAPDDPAPPRPEPAEPCPEPDCPEPDCPEP